MLATDSKPIRFIQNSAGQDWNSCAILCCEKIRGNLPSVGENHKGVEYAQDKLDCFPFKLLLLILDVYKDL